LSVPITDVVQVAEPQKSRMLLVLQTPTTSRRFRHAPLYRSSPISFATRSQPGLWGWLMERWSRTEQVMKLSEAEALARSQEVVSERQQAAQLEVARTTLQYWRERQAATEAPEAVVTFFASPEGLALLHRLVMGAHFVITLLGCGGVRLVCQFLELTGLSAFVAASYGVQQRLNVALEEAVVA
jgi:hypothetical protein